MSEAVLTLLRWCLLALIYLFFFRVLQATWFSTVAGRKAATKAAAGGGGRPEPAKAPAAGRPRASGRGRGRRASRSSAPSLLIIEPATSAGLRFPIATTLSIGRAAGCDVTLDDTFISQVHARVTRDPSGVVIEDLGSTNGTYLNRKKVTAPVVMQVGDVIQVGSTVMELQ